MQSLDSESSLQHLRESRIEHHLERTTKVAELEMPKPPTQAAEGRAPPSTSQGNLRVKNRTKTAAHPYLDWQPKKPDLPYFSLCKLMEPKPMAVTGNSQLYKLQGEFAGKCYKSRGSQREYDMMIAAGDCSVKAYGRSLYRTPKGEVVMDGYVMKLEEPLDPKTVEPGRRRFWMHQMISVVLALHRKGIVHGDIKPANMLICGDGKLRLCDFNEARRVNEDAEIWDGATTDNYVSPSRSQNTCNGQEPPPTVEDDLYGLGLSIWELYKGKIPFEDWYMDDILDYVKTGKTVDIDEVEEEDVREIIRKYLRYGGAKV